MDRPQKVQRLDYQDVDQPTADAPKNDRDPQPRQTNDEDNRVDGPHPPHSKLR